MRVREWFALGVAAMGVLAACASSSEPTVESEPVASDDQELIACGFIKCPRGMRCEPTKDGGGPVDAAVNDARLRTYGVCIPDPCSIIGCPIENTRCVEKKTDAGVTASCVVSPCTLINCLRGTTCVEKALPNGLLSGTCERDP